MSHHLHQLFNASTQNRICYRTQLSLALSPKAFDAKERSIVLILLSDNCKQAELASTFEYSTANLWRITCAVITNMKCLWFEYDIWRYINLFWLTEWLILTVHVWLAAVCLHHVHYDPGPCCHQQLVLVLTAEADDRPTVVRSLHVDALLTCHLCRDLRLETDWEVGLPDPVLNSVCQ